ncbi:MAG TPA: hypothetical protein VHV83_12470, partial [Armatimonadota bacterium]|nr:hypothetical protein [Armatimonadota bacterium]
MSVKVERLPIQIEPDPQRVLSRFFVTDEQKARRRIDRALSLTDDETTQIISELVRQYDGKHYDIDEVWLEHYQRVASLLPKNTPPLSIARRQLIGAYFTMDYALEAVALFNPSIVPSLNQDDLLPDSLRFTLSLRAVGEGHVSSIVMRNGVIDAENNITLAPPNPTRRALPEEIDATFKTANYKRTLHDLGALGPLEELVLDRIGDRVSSADLQRELEHARDDAASLEQWQQTQDNLISLMESNHRLQIPNGADLSELVIFPVSQNESRGIEDLRLVQFTDDGGTTTLCGTYTAFNG